MLHGFGLLVAYLRWCLAHRTRESYYSPIWMFLMPLKMSTCISIFPVDLMFQYTIPCGTPVVKGTSSDWAHPNIKPSVCDTSSKKWC